MMLDQFHISNEMAREHLMELCMHRNKQSYLINSHLTKRVLSLDHIKVLKKIQFRKLKEAFKTKKNLMT